MLAGMAHIPRVYTPEHLSPGPLTLSGDTARRLTGVMRISPGEPLLLFGGDGREWRRRYSLRPAARPVAIRAGAPRRHPRAVVET
jgi:16S rRNA U1498 N3-methylase RsmE